MAAGRVQLTPPSNDFTRKCVPGGGKKNAGLENSS